MTRLGGRCLYFWWLPPLFLTSYQPSLLSFWITALLSIPLAPSSSDRVIITPLVVIINTNLFDSFPLHKAALLVYDFSNVRFLRLDANNYCTRGPTIEWGFCVSGRYPLNDLPLDSGSHLSVFATCEMSRYSAFVANEMTSH